MLAKIFICSLLLFAVSAAPAETEETEGKLSPRLIDANPTTKTIFYEVSIIADEDTVNPLLCSGALLNVRFVITSAYCASRRTNLRVKYGTAYSDVTNPQFERALVYKKYIHPYYNPLYLLNDIAILELNPVATGAVTTVVLPTSSMDNYVGNLGIVSGWGASGNYQGYNMILSYKQVDIVNNAYCQQYDNYMSAYKLCVAGRGICEGDQGAPLVVGNVLAGIASAAQNALVCDSVVINTYTRVNYYLGWITQIINRPCCT